MSTKVEYLSFKEVSIFNQIQIKHYSPNEQIGVKGWKLLESAINRPKQSVFGEDAYPTLFDKAAALFQSLVLNHPFYNANKRTALMSTIIFLKKNGYDLKLTDVKEAEDFTVSIATDHIDIETISQWIEENSVERK